MKLKQHLIALFALTFIIACQSNNGQKKESDFFHIDIPLAIEHQKDIPLSEIAESIIYIPLETNPDGLLGYVTKVVFTSSAIYVSDPNRILKFTPDGKFIRQIGNKGNGPGEYNGVSDFCVAENQSSLFIGDFGHNGILKFDTIGNYQKSIETGIISSKLKYIEPDKLLHYYTQLGIDGNHSYIQLTDLEFNPIAKYKNQVLETGNWSIGVGPVYQYNKLAYYRQNYNDTVYQITADKLVPRGILTIGKYLFPKDFSIGMGGDNEDIEKARKPAKDKLTFHSIFESDQFMIIKLTQGIARTYENPPIILYKKKSKEVLASNSSGFVNDIDNGPSFIPKYRINDNLYIDYVEALNFKTKILDEAFDSQSDNLLKLANSLNENDNPVLMLVKLKE